MSSSIARDLWRPSNLLSLSRIPLAVCLFYYLSRDSKQSLVMAVLLMVLAGLTDALDGALARRFGSITRLGEVLDPICDKVFASILVLGLFLYRDFPLWLLIAILARDLIIVAGSWVLYKERAITVPSNLTGKYAFASIAVLLGCYVIKYDFGIALMTPIAMLLLVASIIIYMYVYIKANRAGSPPVFPDKRSYRLARIALTVAVSIAMVVGYYYEVIR